MESVYVANGIVNTNFYYCKTTDFAKLVFVLARRRREKKTEFLSLLRKTLVFITVLQQKYVKLVFMFILQLFSLN